MSSGKNIAASVRQRLLNHSKASGEEFQLTLNQFATERLLYRLSQSPYHNQFFLKGARLFMLWTKERHRPTIDVDFLSTGKPDIPILEKTFRQICEQEVVDDGLEFLPKSIQAKEIREDNLYGGIRIQMIARLGTTRIPMQVDIGFGDSIYPKPSKETFPALLDFPAPEILAYSMYTSIAEKVEAAVTLGIANSRMKDFYDIWTLLQEKNLDPQILREAIHQTFQRRKTPLPTKTPFAFTEEFTNAPNKQVQWKSFLKKNNITDTEKLPFGHIIKTLCDYFEPIFS